MRWRMMLEFVGADGTRQVHEVGAGERSPAGHAAATLGLGVHQRVGQRAGDRAQQVGAPQHPAGAAGRSPAGPAPPAPARPAPVPGRAAPSPAPVPVAVIRAAGRIDDLDEERRPVVPVLLLLLLLLLL